MKAAAIASSSKPVPAAGSAELRRAGEHDAGEGGQHAHVDEQPEVTLLVLTPDSSAACRLPPTRVDVAAEDAVVHHRRVDQHQHGQDDQDDRRAAVAGQHERDAQHEHGDEGDLDRNQARGSSSRSSFTRLPAFRDPGPEAEQWRRTPRITVSGSNASAAGDRAGSREPSVDVLRRGTG